ncbi:MAG: hypothetical protein ACRD3T_20560, partial [Terriglobia bacterium]
DRRYSKLHHHQMYIGFTNRRGRRHATTPLTAPGTHFTNALVPSKLGISTKPADASLRSA